MILTNIFTLTKIAKAVLKPGDNEQGFYLRLRSAMSGSTTSCSPEELRRVREKISVDSTQVLSKIDDLIVATRETAETKAAETVGGQSYQPEEGATI